MIQEMWELEMDKVNCFFYNCKNPIKCSTERNFATCREHEEIWAEEVGLK